MKNYLEEYEDVAENFWVVPQEIIKKKEQTSQDQIEIKFIEEVDKKLAKIYF